MRTMAMVLVSVLVACSEENGKDGTSTAADAGTAAPAAPQQTASPSEPTAPAPPTEPAPPGPAACKTEAECSGKCPSGSKGCTCAPTPQGSSCIPTCTVAADCPKVPDLTLQCREGTCAP